MDKPRILINSGENLFDAALGFIATGWIREWIAQNRSVLVQKADELFQSRKTCPVPFAIHLIGLALEEPCTR
jgi:hypothetical protein